MKFEKHFPAARLRPYIKYFVVSENECESEYKVLPVSGLVIGFQYKGHLAVISDHAENRLTSAGITGISDSYRIFRSSAGIGTILVYFTETGFAHFARHPANELFNLSLSLDDIFDRCAVAHLEEHLSFATTDTARLDLVQQFLLSQLVHIQSDSLVREAVRLIQESEGTIRIRQLNEKLCISQSPFEKRFRKVVGTTPKKFASIVRLQAVVANLNGDKSLTEIAYEHEFFDQAHFTKAFKQFTGETPETFKTLS